MSNTPPTYVGGSLSIRLQLKRECLMRPALVAIAIALLAIGLPAAPPSKSPPPSWPMLGGSPARNMANTAGAGLSAEFPKDKDADGKEIRVLGNRVKWKATLGTWCYTQPVVSGDRVLVGTNNENPRNNRDRMKATPGEQSGAPVDKGVLICFRASDGQFLWQAVTDILQDGQASDWPRTG